MEQEQLVQVLSILVQAAEMGQAKGAFALADAGVIAQAVAVAKQEIESANKAGEEAPMQVVDEKPKKKSK